MRSSHIWAILILVAVGGWLASGDLIVGGQGDTPARGPAALESDEGADALRNGAAGEDRPFRVRVQNISAEPYQTSLTLRARTEAKQRVTLRAQTSGLVEHLAARKGERVPAGGLICRIETGVREAQVLRAQAALAQAELDHDAATRLRQQGHAAETRLLASRSTLDSARAALVEAELDVARTSIRAPFDGVVEALPAELGALLNVGDPCAEIVAQSPMLIVADVSERDVARLAIGQSAEAVLVSGERVNGTVSYIAASADPATRTFRVEVEVGNEDGRVREGVTAQIALALDTMPTHSLSPSVLVLDDDGRIGVRIVDSESRVRFVPVVIVADAAEGTRVAGLPETVTVITVGQDYVSDGAVVEAVEAMARNDAGTRQ